MDNMLYKAPLPEDTDHTDMDDITDQDSKQLQNWELFISLSQVFDSLISSWSTRYSLYLQSSPHPYLDRLNNLTASSRLL